MPNSSGGYLQYKGMDAGLEAGTYTLRQTMTIPEIAEALQSGRRPERVLTVREGLRLEEVAATVAAQTGIPEADFIALATTGWRETDLKDYPFLADLPPEDHPGGVPLPGDLPPAGGSDGLRRGGPVCWRPLTRG
jgi:cell division protein YceG involved in septum cleavage